MLNLEIMNINVTKFFLNTKNVVILLLNISIFNTFPFDNMYMEKLFKYIYKKFILKIKYIY